jgi:hypothetical protein
LGVGVGVGVSVRARVRDRVRVRARARARVGVGVGVGVGVRVRVGVGARVRGLGSGLGYREHGDARRAAAQPAGCPKPLTLTLPPADHLLPPSQLTEWHVGSRQQRASHSARLCGAGALTIAVP